jgi:DNA modification methylase
MIFEDTIKYDVVFCDYVYERMDFSWALKYFQFLKPDGIFIAMSDFHTQHRYRVYMEDVVGATFVNHLVWLNEWGNYPKNKFHQCYDDVMIYSNSKKWAFDPSVIQVPKKTVGKGMNPSGRLTKPATCWIDDITLTTTSKERVKKDDGHLLQWQKPMRIFDRVVSPFVSEGANILDPFMGSGSLGKWSMAHGYSFTGIELDSTVFGLAHKNMFGE